MPEAGELFEYVALDAEGRRKRGSVAGTTEAEAFASLIQSNLSPLSLQRRTNGQARLKLGSAGLGDRRGAELLSDLAVLLGSGSSLRDALELMRTSPGHPAIKSTCNVLLSDISAGMGLESAFLRHFQGSRAFVGALVAAGELSGRLAATLERAAQMLQTRVSLRDKLISTLSYPCFVMLSAFIAFVVILLVVIPALEPLLAEAQEMSTLTVLAETSEFVRANGHWLLLGAILILLAFVVTHLVGLLRAPVDAMIMNGPAKQVSRGLAYGGFSIVIGNILGAGAPMADALRLSIRSVSSPSASKLLETAAQEVRQGGALSSALERVQGFPLAISRLAAIGEASGALGEMLAKAGRIEEERAIRRIEAWGSFAGPALIILLGGLIGLLMASLLAGISSMGDSLLS